jgi:hypothetical protein
LRIADPCSTTTRDFHRWPTIWIGRIAGDGVKLDRLQELAIVAYAENMSDYEQRRAVFQTHRKYRLCLPTFQTECGLNFTINR